MAIWFTSDTHYNHKNICKGVSRWEDKGATRDFSDLKEMNGAIVSGINKHVKIEDTLYHLGDWSFGGKDSIEDFRYQIYCQDVHLIYGNHDHTIETDSRYRPLFSSTGYLRHIYIGKNNQPIVMCHFALRVWDGIGKGAWNLFGHSHNRLTGDPYGKSLDVGIDSAFAKLGEYRPFSFEEVRDIMDKREILKVDHHDRKSNSR